MQARARRTREKILAQAKRAFAERGFEATNLTEHILTPAGVSVGSFYHQFSNKREVLLEIFEHAIEARHARVGAVIAESQAGSFAEALREVLDVIFDGVDDDPDIARIQFREYESPDPEIRRRSLIGVDGWIDIVTRLAAPWYPTADPGAHDAARVVVLIGFGALREYVHASAAERPQIRGRLLDPAIEFAVAGLDRALGPAA